MKPIPDSTDRNFSSGKRGRMPEKSRSVSCLPLSRNSEIAATAFMRPAPICWKRSGVKPSSKVPAPMWKLTGRSQACVAAQSGSQSRLARIGMPWLCGAPLKRTPLCPAFAQRSTSATDAATSQNGVAQIGTKRRGSGEIQSIRKSL